MGFPVRLAFLLLFFASASRSRVFFASNFDRACSGRSNVAALEGCPEPVSQRLGVFRLRAAQADRRHRVHPGVELALFEQMSVIIDRADPIEPRRDLAKDGIGELTPRICWQNS